SDPRADNHEHQGGNQSQQVLRAADVARPRWFLNHDGFCRRELRYLRLGEQCHRRRPPPPVRRSLAGRCTEGNGYLSPVTAPPAGWPRAPAVRTEVALLVSALAVA